MRVIKAAVVREKSGPFELEEVQLDAPRDHEVLVEIRGTGICHTDIVVRDQYFPTPLPAVLGHEGAGVVVQVGAAVTKVVPGDHVVLTYASCGVCANCQKGPVWLLPGSLRAKFLRCAAGRHLAVLFGARREVVWLFLRAVVVRGIRDRH
jgi:Zn-dependent alcohol dehydrogenase